LQGALTVYICSIQDFETFLKVSVNCGFAEVSKPVCINKVHRCVDVTKRDLL